MKSRWMGKRVLPVLTLTMLALWGGVFSERVQAGTAQEEREYGRIAEQVVQLMEQAHIRRIPVDETISQRMHQAYLQMIDPLKMYFLQEDINEFAQELNRHGAAVKVGDLSFRTRVYQRYLQRSATRSQWAIDLAKQDFDFSKPEVMVVDPKAAEYAPNDQEAYKRWRVRVKYEILRRLVDGEKPEVAREKVAKKYRTMQKRALQVSDDETAEMYLQDLTASFDPHSTYMSPKTLEDFNIAIQLSLDGIGALLQSEDGTTEVKEIVTGGAADKDGRLKPGDHIVGVGQGTEGEIEDVTDMKLRDVVKLIRGHAGTKVQLEVIPSGKTEHVKYTLTRAKIELNDSEAKGEVVTLARPNGQGDYRIGVIRLPSFYADNDAVLRGDANAKTATNDVRRLLEDFKQQKVDGVVMDLRMNGGGLLNEAISLTGLFIKDGPIVQVRDYQNRQTVYPDEDDSITWEGPLVVVVNRFSASASEIFAGAIQDYGRGLVIGDSSTHGKGTVQKVVDLGRTVARLLNNAKLGAVKLTIQKFYRPNGESTQLEGVHADVVIPSWTDNDEFSEGKLDYALNFDKIGQAPHQWWRGGISKEIVEVLRQQAGERAKTVPELVKLYEQKKKADERRAAKVLTFTEESLRKERDDLSAEEKEELRDDGASKKEKEKDKKYGTDPYTREVLAITADYLRLLQSSFTQR